MDGRPDGHHRRMKRESWLPAAPESVALARAAVRDAGRRLHLEEPGLWELTLATSEAVANAVEHGGTCADGTIALRIRSTQTEIEVEVCDCGHFTTALPEPDVDAVRGRGIRLISELVDRLEIETGAEQTQVRFGKRLELAA